MSVRCSRIANCVLTASSRFRSADILIALLLARLVAGRLTARGYTARVSCARGFRANSDVRPNCGVENLQIIWLAGFAGYADGALGCAGMGALDLADDHA